MHFTKLVVTFVVSSSLQSTYFVLYGICSTLQRFQTETRSSKKGQKTENWKQEFVDNYQRGVVNIGFGDQNIEELKDDYRNMGVFMGVHWIAMLHKLWVKIGIVIIAIAWLVVAFAGMLSIKPLEENENFTGEHTFLMKSLHGMQDFAPMKNEIRIMFGVKGLADRKTWHADDFGIVDYYDDVEFHTKAQQEWMLEYCEMLRTWRSKNEESLIKIDENVNCVFEKFRDYILSSESGLGNGSANVSSYPLLKPDVSDDSDDQRDYYLEHLYEWYHNSASGVPERNAYRLDIEEDSETYIIKTARLFVESAANFWSLQSEADHEEARFREFMADSRIACEATLGDANDPLCNPTITSARWSWSEGMFCVSSMSPNHFNQSLFFFLVFRVSSILGQCKGKYPVCIPDYFRHSDDCAQQLHYGDPLLYQRMLYHDQRAGSDRNGWMAIWSNGMCECNPRDWVLCGLLRAYLSRVHCGTVEAQSRGSVSIRIVAEWSCHLIVRNDFDSVHDSCVDQSGRGIDLENGVVDRGHYYYECHIHIHDIHVDDGYHCS